MTDLMDDVWGSDESDNNLLMNDLNKLKDQHSKRGYLDGIVSAKEVNLQDAFNNGFPNGAQLGFEIGKIIGNLQFLENIHGKSDSQLSQDYKLAQADLNITNVLNKKLFDENYDIISDDNINPGEVGGKSDIQILQHPLLKKWSKIVKEYNEKYSHKSLQ